MHHLSYLVSHYGYFGIIVALIGGIIGLPIPDEVLLTYVGYNVFQGKMAFLPSVASALFGACCGITLSFLLGIKLGVPFLNKYGPKLHISEAKVARTRKLFDKFGPFLLLIGFFIPGVRHITAYLAGINSYSYKKFSLFAYTGAIIWCTIFITLGRALGENWIDFRFYFSKYSIYLVLIFVLGCVIFYNFWRKRKMQKVF
ncbi:DedA family protein [Bacillus sp. BRMEA1]|uniref:DedA family protein n=1 Tax=Neobacillus endophyticus TaxID=2738405 RepID=UPI0015631274|nr:DedA family protein [Neobacillus endophyticus]NRD77796.1 DedA family protein [Neobacillus endophyticus]